MPDAARIAEAFGRGCDVRIAGRPRWHCPYPSDGEDAPRRAFMRGYDHVSEFWGRDAKGPVKPLRTVQGDRGHAGDEQVSVV